jgi:hypothetical protein
MRSDWLLRHCCDTSGVWGGEGARSWSTNCRTAGCRCDARCWLVCFVFGCDLRSRQGVGLRHMKPPKRVVQRVLSMTSTSRKRASVTKTLTKGFLFACSRAPPCSLAVLATSPHTTPPTHLTPSKELAQSRTSLKQSQAGKQASKHTTNHPTGIVELCV